MIDWKPVRELEFKPEPFPLSDKDMLITDWILVEFEYGGIRRGKFMVDRIIKRFDESLGFWCMSLDSPEDILHWSTTDFTSIKNSI